MYPFYRLHQQHIWTRVSADLWKLWKQRTMQSRERKLFKRLCQWVVWCQVWHWYVNKINIREVSDEWYFDIFFLNWNLFQILFFFKKLFHDVFNISSMQVISQAKAILNTLLSEMEKLHFMPFTCISIRNLSSPAFPFSICRHCYRREPIKLCSTCNT